MIQYKEKCHKLYDNRALYMHAHLKCVIFTDDKSQVIITLVIFLIEKHTKQIWSNKALVDWMIETKINETFKFDLSPENKHAKNNMNGDINPDTSITLLMEGLHIFYTSLLKLQEVK